jgi:hypothetical protein
MMRAAGSYETNSSKLAMSPDESLSQKRSHASITPAEWRAFISFLCPARVLEAGHTSPFTLEA